MSYEKNASVASAKENHSNKNGDGSKRSSSSRPTLSRGSRDSSTSSLPSHSSSNRNHLVRASFRRSHSSSQRMHILTPTSPGSAGGAEMASSPTFNTVTRTMSVSSSLSSSAASTPGTPTSPTKFSHRVSLENKLKKTLSSQVIQDFKQNLKDYVISIESALGAAKMGSQSDFAAFSEIVDESSSSSRTLPCTPSSPLTSPQNTLYSTPLSEHQKQCKDNLYLSVDLLLQKMRYAEDELSSLREENHHLNTQLSRTRKREKDLIQRIDSIAQLNSARSNDTTDNASVPEEEIQLEKVLDSYQSDFVETKKKLKLVEKRLKFYELLKSQSTNADALENLDLPHDMVKEFQQNNDKSGNSSPTTDTENSIEAPKEKVCIIFVDLRSSTALWEAASDEMFKAILLYHSKTRELCKKHNIYVCKCDGDGFLLACDSPSRSVSFCLELQEVLLHSDWPESLLKHQGANTVYSKKDPNKILYRGLVARCGCHFSLSPRSIVDPMTGRVDFLGVDVNLAARLEQAASAGELAISNDMYQLIKSDLQKQKFDFKVCFADRGKVKLKGFEHKERVRALVPASLAERLDFHKTFVAQSHVSGEPSPTAEDSVAMLEEEQKKLINQVENMKAKIMNKLKTCSERNIMNTRSNFIQEIEILTNDPTQLNVDRIISSLKQYQAAMEKQQSDLATYSSKVEHLAGDAEDEGDTTHKDSSSERKRAENVKRVKRLKKKVKKRQNSCSQLSADIHRATRTSAIKVKTDTSLQSELDDSKAQISHLKNEVAILRRALKQQSGNDRNSGSFTRSSPVAGTLSHSYTLGGHSPPSGNHSYPSSSFNMGSSPPSFWSKSGGGASRSPNTPSSPVSTRTSNDNYFKAISKPLSGSSPPLFVKLPHINSPGSASTPHRNSTELGSTSGRTPVERKESSKDPVAAVRTRGRKRSRSMVVPSRSPIRSPKSPVP